MEIGEAIVQIVVVVGFGIWAYSKFKRQSIAETIEEIKEIYQKIN